MYKLGGYKPSPTDLNYNSFATVNSKMVKMAASVDQEYRIPEFTPISDQGGLSSCVANAIADSAEILIGLEGKSVVQLSRLFIYWNARVYTQDTDKDLGTFIHNGFDSLQTLGVCPESEWPYQESKVFAQPPIRAYKTANDNKISSYYRIDSTGQQRLKDVEAAIRSNHPVVFGTGVSSDFTKSFGADKVWTIPNNTVGNHAMIIVGVRYNPTVQFYVRNSWGLAWNSAGHCWMDGEYIAWSGTQDIWVPTRVDDLIF